MQKLADLGDLRIADMDATGIDVQLLLLGAPGVQIFEATEATVLAREVNDAAAAAVKAHPGRFAALAAIAPQSPADAASELERAVHTLGMKGAIINSHSRGEYLDDPKFSPIFEAAQALDVPIYIHPREPSPQMVQPYLAYGATGPIWGFNAETGLHAIRLILGGVFDRFPKLRIVLGHLGEGLPFFLDRMDIRYRVEQSPDRPRLAKKPSDCFKDNFVVTTSGMNWWPAVELCQRALGTDKVLFAVDYPFEDGAEAVATADAMPMSEAAFTQFYHANAERIFQL
jgi:2,3-dihydroxybenzoate decarboxylase